LPRITSSGDAKRRRVVDDRMNDGAVNRGNKVMSQIRTSTMSPRGAPARIGAGLALCSCVVAAWTAPVAAQSSAREAVIAILSDERICWAFEARDNNGVWGEAIYWQPKPSGNSMVLDALRVPRTPQGLPEPGSVDIVKQGPDVYIYSRKKFGGRSDRRLHKVPCPEPVANTGAWIGLEILKNWGRVDSTERSAATGAVTNEFSDSADPLGGGFAVGYKFAPWASSVVISPFASFDFLHAPVNHTFPGGSFLGTTANFMGTFGVKAGPQLDTGLWLYGIAGVSVLNETLNVNFIPVSSSRSAWVAGATVGLGGAWQPAFLQRFGRPVSLFAEYQHTWWQDATFTTPGASPFFNYTFARQDDVVKFGFTVSLDTPSASPPSYPVKALPPK
jgi:hypothetical protein